MIFVVDTSSALSAVALLEADGAVVKEALHPSGRTFDLPAAFRALGADRLTRVAVAVGPGSFTGLRTGVSFGLGLAMGLRIPIVGLPTLELQSARSSVPVIAVAEAGRGRVYFQAPGAAAALAAPEDLPGGWAVAGWLRESTAAAVRATGRQVLTEDELDSFGTAAGRLLRRAVEVPYGRLKIAYMQSFRAAP